jgi:hypothetical protein
MNTTENMWMINRFFEQARQGRKITAVDWVANMMPWAGSSVPAVMTFQNVQKLGFEPWQALVIGLVVEGMGFVSITTMLDIYEANVAERQKTGNPSRPLFDGAFWVALGGAGVYLVAVLMVNAILDGGDAWQKVTLALLSLFGVVGGIMVALRNQLGKRLVTNNQAAEEQKQAEERERLAAEKREAEALEHQRMMTREALEHQRRMDEERLRLEHEERAQKIEAESRRKLEKLKADGLRRAAEESRRVSAETPEGSGDGRILSAESPAGHRRWSDIPASEYGWISEAPVGEVVKKYQITGKDPERLARTWKTYARDKKEAA